VPRSLSSARVAAPHAGNQRRARIFGPVQLLPDARQVDPQRRQFGFQLAAHFVLLGRQIQFVALLGKLRQLPVRAERGNVVRVRRFLERFAPPRNAIGQRLVNVPERIFGCLLRGLRCAVFPQPVECASGLNRLLRLIAEKRVFQRRVIVVSIQFHGGFKLVSRFHCVAGLQQCVRQILVRHRVARLLRKTGPKLSNGLVIILGKQRTVSLIQIG